MSLARTATRVTTALAGTTAGLVLLAGPAAAHFCYFAAPNERADAQRSQNRVFEGFREVLHTFAPCAEAADAVITRVEGEFPLDVQVHAKATMAGGAQHRGFTVKPISHITEQEFAVLDAAIEEVAALVEAGELCA
jgi:hypothetical protein